MVSKIKSSSEKNNDRDAIFGVGHHALNLLNNGEWDFHNEDTQQHLHSLHPYPARFIPQIPRKAILLWSAPGDIILDPFCGCGTSILESSLLGRPSVGIDNNPVAVLVTKAKTAKYSNQDLKTLESFLIQLDSLLKTKSDESIFPDYKNFDYWFSLTAKNDLGRLKSVINQLSGASKLLALAVFSSIIVRASYQHSDTRYVRVSKIYTKGDAFRWFKTRLTASIESAREIIGSSRAKSKVLCSDSRRMNMIRDNHVQMIVTSPPYINAYDYHKYHRHRMHWIDGDVEFARDTEIGKHDTFTRANANATEYFNDMLSCFVEWKRILKNKGYVFIVVGDGIVNGSPVKAGEGFIDIAKKTGFVLKKRWIRELQKDKKSFNQKARINKEHVLLFQKIAKCAKKTHGLS